jgi:hypothetical protein
MRVVVLDPTGRIAIVIDEGRGKTDVQPDGIAFGSEVVKFLI